MHNGSSHFIFKVWPQISRQPPSPPKRSDAWMRLFPQSTDRFIFIDPKVFICSGAKQHLHTELLEKHFLQTESKLTTIIIMITAATTKRGS